MKPGRSTQGGWSLVEVAAGIALTGLIALGALALTDTSRVGATTARQNANQTGWLRKAAGQIREDLSQTTSSRLTVVKTSGQNDIVTLQRPLPNGGWGAWQPNANAALRMLPDHSICYRVDQDETGRTLRRQVLDPASVVIGEEVLARGLATGNSSPPGLRIDQAGDMWRVTVGLLPVGTQPPESLTFDVALRN